MVVLYANGRSILSTCCYVLNAWVCAFLRRYKVTKSFVLLSLSLSHSHSFYYSVGPLLAPTLFFSRIYFFVFYVSLLRGVLFYRLLFVS